MILWVIWIDNLVKYCTFSTTLFISILLLVNPLLLLANDSSYWQCSTMDNDNKQWVFKNRYERAARGRTMEACKQQSQAPNSCKTDCEEFYHGISTRPAWQCTALDENAKPWVSHIYSRRDEAAIAAKKRCEEHSTIPESCILHFFTCKNLHHWP